MDELSRRALLGVSMVVGSSAVLGAQNDKKEAKKPVPKDRDFVMAAGMTEAEADCWEATAKAAGLFFSLPKLHPMDDHEVAHAIHVVQQKLLSRPTYRKYLELAKAQAGKAK
jgi:hypothetical protein